MDVEEARRMAAGNPWSFLHISRPEIDLPADVHPYDDEVYRQGRRALDQAIAAGVFLQDDTPCYYLYRQTMGRFQQTGLVACASVDDYQSGVIRKHELTRQDKEDDRVRHIDILNAHDEPVFYTFRRDPEIASLYEAAASQIPVYDFTTHDGVSHTFWVVRDLPLIDRFTELFARIPVLYVADGHHRSAAASRVREIRRGAHAGHTGEEEYNHFLTVIFPDHEMNIMPYNRVVTDLNGLTVAEFMTRVSHSFDITPQGSAVEPSRRHSFGMYLSGRWYELSPRTVIDESDPVERLDVSILQTLLLSPILGIRNPRTDTRIGFIGGIRGVGELERLVDAGSYAVAFSLYPTTMDDLMTLADADKIMPPKSTWFEPKLRSGLCLHLLS
jgi:uncharacterized protein (DUF1015 family)